MPERQLREGAQDRDKMLRALVTEPAGHRGPRTHVTAELCGCGSADVLGRVPRAVGLLGIPSPPPGPQTSVPRCCPGGGLLGVRLP